jgi:hypothetical protein
MAKKLARSQMEREGHEINMTYNILTSSVNKWFKDKIYENDRCFLLEDNSEIETIRQIQLSEVEKYTAFDMIASIEAMFKIDYCIRCENKLRDDLSRDFREIYKIAAQRVSLQKDILTIWLKYNPGNSLLKELNTIFQYRHWIAHGRYWRFNTQISRKYDFKYLYTLYTQLKNNLIFSQQP